MDTQQGSVALPGAHPEPSSGASTEGRVPGFSIKLENFEGPFDLLLQLISRHKMDVTEVALSVVTDEYIAHIAALEGAWKLDEATEFLVVAATLLDLKAARLLPSGEIDDEEDLALLEARDLLFARLLQYKAYKEIAATFQEWIEAETHRYPRLVALDPKLAALLPEVLIGVGVERFALLATRALTPKTPPVFSISHLHSPAVSVREEAQHVVAHLRRVGTATFRALVADASHTLVVVARFLSLLELYKEGVLHFEQVTPLGDLQIRWVGSAEGDIAVTDEFDRDPGSLDAQEAQEQEAQEGESQGE
jgi:segregation and condensation protein A